MCLMQISDILYEVMLLFGQNMSHCVMSQTVLNGMAVKSHDKPMRHTKRNEVFLRLFHNHWSHKYSVCILYIKQMSVILAAFVPNCQVKSPFLTQSYLSPICRCRYINTHVCIRILVCVSSYTQPFVMNLRMVAGRPVSISASV